MLCEYMEIGIKYLLHTSVQWLSPGKALINCVIFRLNLPLCSWSSKSIKVNDLRASYRYSDLDIRQPFSQNKYSLPVKKKQLTIFVVKGKIQTFKRKWAHWKPCINHCKKARHFSPTLSLLMQQVLLTNVIF